MTRARYPWWLAPASVAAAGVIWLLGKTWRLVWVDVRVRDALFAGGGRCIFALWHARLLPLVFTHRRRGVAVLISQHRDGELIARSVTRLGYVTGRGSSTRGGDEGMREMLAYAESGRSLALTPDGPRGPAERVKLGLVYLASRTGLPVLPVAAAARPTWILRSWDGFRVPTPFARLVVAYGQPILVPPRLPDDQVEVWRETIESGIRGVTEKAERIASREGKR